MTQTDKVYLDLLRDIMENGVEKDTRAGKVKSVFGRQLRFDLKEGLPLLTTKKVFTKGVIHELLWFLQHPHNSHDSMNIEYLVRNGVHIWDDDAYRWFKNYVVKNFPIEDEEEVQNGWFHYKLKGTRFMVCTNDDEKEKKAVFEHWIESDARKKDKEWLGKISKDEFIDLTLQKVEIWCDELKYGYTRKYRFGDLGPVYGKQWRAFGNKRTNQIEKIINTLKTNPNDRRMLCIAFNPDDIDKMALPPCHVMFQFYTRELTNDERMKIFNERYMKGEIPQKYYYWFKEYSKNVKGDMDVEMPDDGSHYDIADIPKYGLSCMWTQRSVDAPLGLCWNIVSYSILTHIIAKLVNMVPDELVGSLGDCHIYLNQIEGVKEHLNREGYDELPKLVIEGDQKCIEDFKYDDFKIFGYKCDPIIKMPLSVG